MSDDLRIDADHEETGSPLAEQPAPDLTHEDSIKMSSTGAGVGAGARGALIAIGAFLVSFGAGAAYERFALYADHTPTGLYQHTAVVRRAQGMQFIDSADAICDRAYAGPSYKCRAAIKEAVLRDRIVYSFGYSDLLYLISTRGRRVDEDKLRMLYELTR